MEFPILITDCPRSMSPFRGLKPFLLTQIELLIKAGFKTFILPRRQDVFDYFGNGSKLDIQVHYASTRFGSAGMIRKALRWFTHRLFVLEGSAWVDCKYDKLLKDHVEQQVWATVVRAGYTNVGLYLFDQVVLRWIPECRIFDTQRDLLPALYNGGVDLHFWTPKADTGVVAQFV